MSRRLEFLLKVTSSNEAEPFAWYGLAMEYRTLGRHEEALATFAELRTRAPDYVPMYLMCGQMLESMGRLAEAREWLTYGIGVAGKRRDEHAASELQTALAALER
jgi:tetratricopeptide (TPR) repeat protein